MSGVSGAIRATRAPDDAKTLALHHDELLPKQRVLGDKTGAPAHDVGGQPHHEPKDVDHAAHRTAASAGRHL
jgi:hypothetical protein